MDNSVKSIQFATRVWLTPEGLRFPKCRPQDRIKILQTEVNRGLPMQDAGNPLSFYLLAIIRYFLVWRHAVIARSCLPPNTAVLTQQLEFYFLNGLAKSITCPSPSADDAIMLAENRRFFIICHRVSSLILKLYPSTHCNHHYFLQPRSSSSEDQ
jgi:hypothetical protein